MESTPVTIMDLSSMPALIPLRFPGSKDIYTSSEAPLNLVKIETNNKNTQPLSTQENTPSIFYQEKETNSSSEKWGENTASTEWIKIIRSNYYVLDKCIYKFFSKNPRSTSVINLINLLPSPGLGRD